MHIKDSEIKRSFWCFISYRHADNQQPGRQWATWLHHALETYEVPADLVGSPNLRGELIPERIYPVFRDEEELPADADLSRPIISALNSSRCLLVICSPRACESRFVADEIARFKAMGKSDRVIAAIVAGEPNASTDPAKIKQNMVECFPKPLRYEVEEDLRISDLQAEPVAADFRIEETGEEGWVNPQAYRTHMQSLGLPAA
ncbi:MAG: toll/interleukin-1 receptor domain-containing protein, partial [Gloeobacteraceae cyanobacterium ES-bin-144]|nr:toll/interleukin-1 receptor domain-containing protein [Verrucomicrobiales bacterium]